MIAVEDLAITILTRHSGNTIFVKKCRSLQVLWWCVAYPMLHALLLEWYHFIPYEQIVHNCAYATTDNEHYNKTIYVQHWYLFLILGTYEFNSINQRRKELVLDVRITW